MICFADLKKYKFTYLFGFPALHSDPGWRSGKPSDTSPGDASEKRSSNDVSVQLSGDETTALVDSVQTWRYSVDVRQYGFFLAKRDRTSAFGFKKEGAGEGDSHNEYNNGLRPITPLTPGHNLGFSWVVRSLASYEEGFFKGTDPEDCFVCFADPSNYSCYPGWMLRNLLILIHKRWKLEKVQILCYRDVQARRHEARSIILKLELAGRDEPSSEWISGDLATSQASATPRVTGWERNRAGKVTSKVANLGEHMDPQRLVLN